MKELEKKVDEGDVCEWMCYGWRWWVWMKEMIVNE